METEFGEEYEFVLSWQRTCIDDEHAKKVVLHLLVEFIMRGAGLPKKVECTRKGSTENIFSAKDIVL